MKPVTGAQRATIVRLLKAVEFDTRTVTLMYRRIGVDDAWQGQSVDSWLSSLTTEAASGLIRKLEAIA